MAQVPEYLTHISPNKLMFVSFAGYGLAALGKLNESGTGFLAEPGPHVPFIEKQLDNGEFYGLTIGVAANIAAAFLWATQNKSSNKYDY